MLPRGVKVALKRLAMGVRMAGGRLYEFLPSEPYLKGAFATFEEAMRHASRRQVAGYDHPEVVSQHLDTMSTILSWDYPILFWLREILLHQNAVLDAGGHIGTKYRAFQKLITFPTDLEWIVLELPAAVAEGRRRATQEGLSRLRFEVHPRDLPKAQVLLASGLLQYYPRDLSALLQELPVLPKHLLVNKVAVRDGPAFFTLQAIGPSRVPYQIRNRAQFVRDVTRLGYEIIDQWDIPALAHTIPTHPELGQSTSLGFYFKLPDGDPCIADQGEKVVDHPDPITEPRFECPIHTGVRVHAGMGCPACNSGMI